MKKRSNVSIMTGGGGAGGAGSTKRMRARGQRKIFCHPELDSGSVQRCELSVTPVRFRNGLARLAKNGTAKSVVFA